MSDQTANTRTNQKARGAVFLAAVLVPVATSPYARIAIDRLIIVEVIALPVIMTGLMIVPTLALVLPAVMLRSRIA